MKRFEHLLTRWMDSTRSWKENAEDDMAKIKADLRLMKASFKNLEERFESFTDPDYVPEEDEEDEEESGDDGDDEIDLEYSPPRRITRSKTLGLRKK